MSNTFKQGFNFKHRNNIGDLCTVKKVRICGNSLRFEKSLRRQTRAKRKEKDYTEIQNDLNGANYTMQDALEDVLEDIAFNDEYYAEIKHELDYDCSEVEEDWGLFEDYDYYEDFPNNSFSYYGEYHD